MAAMAPERSRVLHNFSLPPRLSWGVQRLLRCSKVNNPNNNNKNNTDDDDRTTEAVSAVSARNRRESPDSDRKRRSDNNNHNKNNYDYNNNNNRRRSFGIGGGGGGGVEEEETIDVVREKLMLDLHKEVDKMKVKILSSNGGGADKEIDRPPPPPTTTTTVETRPWNLRTRRAACREPIAPVSGKSGGGGGGLRIEEPRRPSSSSPPQRNIGTEKAAGSEIRLPKAKNGGEEDGVGVGVGVGEKRPRAKFSVTLSRQEVEDDFMEMIGKRPPRKPKKRPRYVQKELDTLFPGLWLSEVTADMYRVNEVPELVK